MLGKNREWNILSHFETMGITAIQQLILFERHQFAECLFTILNGKYGLSGKFIHIIKLVYSIVHIDCKNT